MERKNKTTIAKERLKHYKKNPDQAKQLVINSGIPVRKLRRMAKLGRIPKESIEAMVQELEEARAAKEGRGQND